MATEWKKVVLFAFVPAIIAGLFSIAPKAYDIAIEPKTELIYSLTNGPQLQTGDSFQQIVSINIKNNGKTSLNNVRASFIAENGEIISQKIHNPLGNDPTTNLSNKEISVTFARLLTGETFSIAVLIKNANSTTKPTISVRSDETLGHVAIERTHKSDEDLFSLLPTALSASISVMAMALFFLQRTKKGTLFGDYKSDVIFYICYRTGINIADDLKYKDTRLTYLRAAELIFYEGLHSTVKDRKKYVIALKLLLLIKDIANTSKKVIISNINKLQGTELTAAEINDYEKEAVGTDDFMALRNKVDQKLL